jgi:hypothetical protein
MVSVLPKEFNNSNPLSSLPPSPRTDGCVDFENKTVKTEDEEEEEERGGRERRRGGWR